MSAANPKPKAEADAAAAEDASAPKPKKLMLLAVPVVLLLAVAGLWFTGIVPHLLGMDRKPEKIEEAKKAEPPSYVELPEMIANLVNNNPKHPSYIKLVARVEVPQSADVDKVRAAIPRLQDIMQTYLREMRPEELRGSAGTYRLRQELIARANVAVAPATVTDVLFTQMLVQ